MPPQIYFDFNTDILEPSPKRLESPEDVAYRILRILRDSGHVQDIRYVAYRRWSDMGRFDDRTLIEAIHSIGWSRFPPDRGFTSLETILECTRSWDSSLKHCLDRLLKRISELGRGGRQVLALHSESHLCQSPPSNPREDRPSRC
jgi:hypothetical protein